MTEAEKARQKHLHKINGKLFDIQKAGNGIVNFVIYKDGANKRYIAFTAFGEIAYKILNQFKLKDRIKIKFMVNSKQYKDRWYTNLICMEALEWVKNEKSVNYQKAIEEQNKNQIKMNFKGDEFDV